MKIFLRRIILGTMIIIAALFMQVENAKASETVNNMPKKNVTTVSGENRMQEFMQNNATSYTKVSDEYVEGKYIYYFATKNYNNDTLYFCRAKKNGNDVKVLCKTNESDYLDDVDLKIEGHYKNTFFFTIGYYSSGSNFCYVNTNTKKFKHTKYPGVDTKISNTQYILNECSDLGEWCIGSTYYFNAKSGKYKLLAKYCDSNNVIGNNIIYLKSSYDAAYKTHKATVYKYNLKTNKTTKIKEIKKLYQVKMVKSNFLTYAETSNGELKVCSFSNKETTLKNGTYDVTKDVYAHIRRGYLDIYGQIKKNSSKKKLEYKHYRLKLSNSCKFYAIENGEKSKCDVSLFNQIHDSVIEEEEVLRMGVYFTIKNGKVTSVTITD